MRLKFQSGTELCAEFADFTKSSGGETLAAIRGRL
jgi:hypothetical protein